MPDDVSAPEASTPARARPVSPSRRPTLVVLLAGALTLYLVARAAPLVFTAWSGLSALYLLRQDSWLLLCDLVLLAASLLRLRPALREITLPAWAPYALALCVLGFCVAGHRWILDGYDMSRDEQMAVFDARIFATGRLVQPLSAFWQAHASALNTLFMLPVPQPAAWVSAYLPMNAVLRALVGLVVDPALTGPLMTALGLVFLWKCARSLWPADREAAAVAALLYVTSGQILFAGMTSYAMPAHLALDLLWLWLFLQRRLGADIGALAVAAVATGLHQPLFHPLFAVPFLVGLLGDRAWRRAAIYAVGYAAICAFWLAWPIMMHALVAGTGPQAQATLAQAAGTDYLSRLVLTLLRGDVTRSSDMVANLLRFAAWQPILLLPLMAAGFLLAWRERPTCTLAASAVLPIVVMMVILPYQGHGFGYRYLHGVLGPAILLAVQGWRHLARRETRLRPLLLRTTLAGLLVATPLQAVMAHGFYAPFARIDARIRASGAAYVVIGQDDAAFTKDLVLNRPDLSNRPIRLLAANLDGPLMAAICRPGTIVAMPTGALFQQIDAYFMSVPSGAADARRASLSPTLASAGCSVAILGP